jgi:hypothetical protein
VTKVIAVRLERSDGKPITMPAPSEPFDDEDVEYEQGRELVEEPPAKKAGKAAVAAPEAAEDPAADSGDSVEGPAAFEASGETVDESPDEAPGEAPDGTDGIVPVLAASADAEPGEPEGA